MESIKKIVLLGQFGVGKTSLMRRFMTNEFVKGYKTTLGVQIKKKIITLPSGKEMSIIIWDLEGHSSLSKNRSSYLLGSNAFILVFDITRPVTYYNLDVDIKFIQDKYPKVLLRIIGNKADEKDPKSVLEFLKNKNIDIYDAVSAKTGEGVHELFLDLAKNLNTL